MRNTSSKKLTDSTQSVRNIIFSRFLTVHLLVLLLFVAYQLVMGSAAALFNLFDVRIKFIEQCRDWTRLMGFSFKIYLSVFIVSIIQFQAGIRDRSFIIPLVAGLGLMTAAALIILKLDGILCKPEGDYIFLFPFLCR